MRPLRVAHHEVTQQAFWDWLVANSEDGCLCDAVRLEIVVAEPIELIADSYLLKSVVYGIPEAAAHALVKDAGSGKEGYGRAGRNLVDGLTIAKLSEDLVCSKRKVELRLAKGMGVNEIRAELQKTENA